MAQNTDKTGKTPIKWAVGAPCPDFVDFDPETFVTSLRSDPRCLWKVATVRVVVDELFSDASLVGKPCRLVCGGEEYRAVLTELKVDTDFQDIQDANSGEYLYVPGLWEVEITVMIIENRFPKTSYGKMEFIWEETDDDPAWSPGDASVSR